MLHLNSNKYNAFQNAAEFVYWWAAWIACEYSHICYLHEMAMKGVARSDVYLVGDNVQ